MSIAARIVQAMAPTGLEVVQGVYNGQADTYLSFGLMAIPEDFADDAAQAERWLVDLHLFAPHSRNTTALKRQIRRCIRDAGFTDADMTDASEKGTADDGTEQHIVFEFEDAAGWGAE